MSQSIYSLELREDVDVFAARQAGREVAAALGLEGLDLVRIGTALSEISRDVVASGGGTVNFNVSSPGVLSIELVTVEPAPRLGDGAGPGLGAAGRLVDSVTTKTDAGGRAVITLDKRVGSTVVLDDPARADIHKRVSSRAVRSPLDELRTQNRDLIVALEEAQARRDELASLNHELEETNRGVMALYQQLSEELETTNQGVVALYAEIDDKSRQLREASEAKTRFLRNISHELRTPGNSVLGLARLLMDSRADQLTEEQRRQVEFIESSALDLVRLVNDLLDLARAESGNIEPELEDVGLERIFRELEGTTAPLITRPGVVLVVEDATDVGSVRTDPTLLVHVLRNLLSNAVKFTEAGEVRMSAVREGDVVRIAVRDSGVGIAPEDQPKVFEEFFQTRTAMQTAVKGSGLGLPFARRVAHILAGDLTLSSAPGEGSTFTLVLPLRGPSVGPRGEQSS
ncbi:MAG TPA: ATP-binding protein [Nocardioidaceae bacterium]|nr:ATP-binding protein [Nocardioidaceae bacterium]